MAVVGYYSDFFVHFSEKIISYACMARAFSLTCSLPFSDLSLLHGQGPGPRASLLARSNPSTVVAGQKTAIIWIDRAGSRLSSRPGMDSVSLCTCAERVVLLADVLTVSIKKTRCFVRERCDGMDHG